MKSVADVHGKSPIALAAQNKMITLRKVYKYKKPLRDPGRLQNRGGSSLDSEALYLPAFPIEP